MPYCYSPSHVDVFEKNAGQTSIISEDNMTDNEMDLGDDCSL